MRRFYYALAFIMGLLSVTPCAAKVKFGVKGGFNMNEINLSEEIIDSKNRNGFFVGPTFKISTPLFLGFDIAALYDRRDMELGEQSTKMKQEMVAVPVNLRINLGSERTLGAFVYAGPQVAFLINDRKEVIDEAKEWEFKQSNFSANFGVGVLVGGTLQISANYNVALGKTADLTDSAVSDAFDGLKKHDAKTNAWQLSMAVYF